MGGAAVRVLGALLVTAAMTSCSGSSELSVADVKAGLRKNICAAGERNSVVLYRLPAVSPIEVLLRPDDVARIHPDPRVPSEDFVVGQVHCSALRVAGRLPVLQPTSLDVRPGWFYVRGGGLEGWARGVSAVWRCREGVVPARPGEDLPPAGCTRFRTKSDLIPVWSVDPLHPSGLPDLDITTTTIASVPEVGDPCGVEGSAAVGTEVMHILNRGEGTSPAQIEYATTVNGEERIETLVLLRGIEPGEIAVVPLHRRGKITLDPRNLVRESDKSNQSYEIMSGGTSSGGLRCVR